jgi:hypothetical protein
VVPQRWLTDATSMSEDGQHACADSDERSQPHEEKDQRHEHHRPQKDYRWGQRHDSQRRQHGSYGGLFWTGLQALWGWLRPRGLAKLLVRRRQQAS